jgi:putative ABC transport system ATP-binding protein
MAMSLISLKGIKKSYRLGHLEVPALQGVDLEVEKGEFTVVMGPSGSGKTTLLNIIGLLDRADAGSFKLDGEELAGRDFNDMAALRNRKIGFIFQSFNLIPVLTAYENIEYPLRLAKVGAAERRQRVEALLEAVGLESRRNNLPAQLSGGQRQRVAIARALATAPGLVLADEPTANLDSQTGAEIIALMRRMQREQDVSFVFSSHDPQVHAEADDVVFIRDGRIVGLERQRNGQTDVQGGRS